MRKICVRWLPVALVLCSSSWTTALASDTTETFDPGTIDLELYLGHDGHGLRHPAEPESVIEGVVGWGLADGLSLFVDARYSAGTDLSEGQGVLAAGLLGGLLDTDYLDFDLLASVEGETGGEGPLLFVPGFELNLDRAPDLAAYGLYLRWLSPVEFQVEDRSASFDPASFDLTLGTYWSLNAEHQLLLEVCWPAGDSSAAPSTYALGYNVVLSDTVELINQIVISSPADGGPAALGWSTGIIGTLPVSGS